MDNSKSNEEDDPKESWFFAIFWTTLLQTLFPSRNISELVICDTIGPILAARVYFPEGTPCGMYKYPVSGVYQMSKELNKYISPSIPIPPKNYIILIKRTKHRILVQHDEIASFLNDIAKQNDMELFIYADDNLPSFSDTRKLFHQARLVVAPHGAGLANTLFSTPGLFVIEIVCNHPHLNLCYRELAISLGHHYHGVSSQFGCESTLNVDVNEVKEAIQFYIKHIVKKTKS
ncbi:unnamed protein product [Owenia fusiformis]|uniref:Glycosyltransferase 61 catalytic domain-containing protein n=1 Tax=Owenia fusiformis TaxID=6347 RepID=A0A8S4Q4U9_OWEFU|nr:unnamed protein product [Owenia fusiformis]